MSKENVSKFLSCIASLSFSEVLDEQEVDKSFNLFHEHVTLFFNLCFPIIKVKKTNKPVKNCWLSKGLKKCSIRKRQLFKIQTS